MGIIDFARNDWKRLTQDSASGPGVSIVLISPTATETNITGIHTKHHLSVDAEGRLLNSQNAHISYSEEIGPNVRDSKGFVSMKGWRVRVADSTGNPKTYAVNEAWPDETVGVIVITLKNFAS